MKTQTLPQRHRDHRELLGFNKNRVLIFSVSSVLPFDSLCSLRAKFRESWVYALSKRKRTEGSVALLGFV